jgi:cysteine-rich repeat protein
MRWSLCFFLIPFVVSSLTMQACGGSGGGTADIEGDAPGECSDEADNDRDGLFDCDDPDCAGSPACKCSDQCGPEGVSVCEGDVLRTCELSADGCLELVDEDCTLTLMKCVDSECVVPVGTGLCTATGTPCAGDEDCFDTEITGFCIDGPGALYCGYDTRLDTASTVTCEGQTVGHCETSVDCPAGPDVECRTLSADYCAADAEGICVVRKTSCATAAECSFTPANTCATCGDGVVVPVAEQCDDGDLNDGDGCSSDCRFERVCKGDISHEVMDCGCATDADCAAGLCAYCGMQTCSCVLP